MAYTPEITRIRTAILDHLKAEGAAGRINPPIGEFLNYFDPQQKHGLITALVVSNRWTPEGRSSTHMESDLTIRIYVTQPDKNQALTTLERTTMQVWHALNRHTGSWPPGGHLVWQDTSLTVRGERGEEPYFVADINYDIKFNVTYTEDI